MFLKYMYFKQIFFIYYKFINNIIKHTNVILMEKHFYENY